MPVLNDGENETIKDKINMKFEIIYILQKAMSYCVYVILTYVILSIFSYAPEYNMDGISWGMIIFIYIILFINGILYVKYDSGVHHFCSVCFLLGVIWVRCYMSYSGSPRQYGINSEVVSPDLMQNVQKYFIRIKSSSPQGSTDKFITTSIIIQFIALTTLSILQIYPTAGAGNLEDDYNDELKNINKQKTTDS